jgi:hypothetical protein
MDVLDVHVVVSTELARPDPEVPLDPASLLFESFLVETRDLGGPIVTDDAHHARITVSHCRPRKSCRAEPVTFVAGTAEAVGQGDDALLVQWPWAWVEPPSAELKTGATWSGTRRVDLGAGPADFTFDCSLVERKWKGGQVRCTGDAKPVAAAPCPEATCTSDLGSRYTLDVRLDWMTGDPMHWNHTLVTMTLVNGNVARRTVDTSAEVSRGPTEGP